MEKIMIYNKRHSEISWFGCMSKQTEKKWNEYLHYLRTCSLENIPKILQDDFKNALPFPIFLGCDTEFFLKKAERLLRGETLHPWEGNFTAESARQKACEAFKELLGEFSKEGDWVFDERNQRVPMRPEW
jgi:hypothetical protein